MGTPICQAVFSFFSKFFRGCKWGRNAGDGVPYDGDLCGFAGSAVGIGGVYCGTVITVPYTGVYEFALIR